MRRQQKTIEHEGHLHKTLVPHINILPNDTFEVWYIGNGGSKISTIFAGFRAQDRAEDFAEAIEIFLSHTEPGITLAEVVDVGVHVILGADGNEEKEPETMELG